MNWQPEAWSNEAEAMLLPAMGDDLAIIRREVEEGEAKLWRVDGCGFVITRLEHYQEFSELVLVAFAGRESGVILERAQQVCRSLGVRSIRFHTSHNERAAARLVGRFGFQPVETVFRWVA